MNEHGTINYVEFPSRDLPSTKRFYSDVFGWSFQDFGPEYTAIQGAGGFILPALRAMNLQFGLTSTHNPFLSSGGIFLEGSGM